MKTTFRAGFFAFVLLASTVIPGLTSKAQINQTFNYGLYLGGNLNFHSASFPMQAHLTNYPANYLSASDSTSKFSSKANSFGLAIGGLVNIPLNSRFTISGRVGYNATGANLTASSFVKNTLTPGDSTASDATVSSSLGYLEISPVLQAHNLFEKTPIYLAAGLEFGVPLIAKYSVSEAVAGSQTIPAPNPNPIQHAVDLAIPNAGVRTAIVIGAGWPLKISDRAWLAPEVTYRIPLANISSQAGLDAWSASQLRFGINLSFASAPQDIIIKKSTLESGFDGVGYYDGAGNFAPLSQIRVEDISYSELFPMLPYIFFPNAGVTPSDSLQRLYDPGQKGVFNVSALAPDAVEINKSTLDVIGSRMKEYPSAKLTIIGANDGKGEVKNKGLSQQRAEYAKQYLQTSYDVSPDRLSVQSRDLPEKFSATAVPDGEAENRRVEFRSLTPEILDPILMKSDNKRIAFPDFVEFRPSARSNYPITTWKLSVSQAGRSLREYSGSGEPAPQRWLIRPNELSDKQVPVDYSFTASDSSGASSEANGSLPVEYLSGTKKKVEQLSDRSIAKFSLVLFDFDKSELTPENKRILETIVLPSVQYNSTVKVFGYTDRIGDAEYNRKLSTSRAVAVKNAIEAKVKDAKYETYGLGESVPIFDNNSPIGRQLSRTVQIYVETPTK